MTNIDAYDVIRLSSRQSFDTRTRDDLLALLDGEPDWNLVLKLAGVHGVTPLVYQTLANHVLDEVPDGVLSFLKTQYVRTAAQNLSQVKELGHIQSMFSDSGIRMISFKGVVLATETYGSLALRPSTDLDILIEPSRFNAVRDVLRTAGYQQAEKEDSGHLLRAVYRYTAQQVVFYRTTPDVQVIDVHLNLMPPGYYYKFEFNDLFKRSHTVTLGNSEIVSFQTEDLLQIMCYQGVKNRWERLKHICDIDAIITSNPNMDWDQVRARAVKTRGEGTLFLGLYLSHALLGTALPTEIREELRSFDRVHKFGDWLMQRLPDAHETGIAEFGDRVRFHLGIQDNLSNKVRYCMYALARKLG